MCGRFVLTLPVDAMARLFAAAPANDLPLGPQFNICPTTPIAVVDGARRLRPMRWGFVPRWYKTPTDGPLLINARAETIADKPAFRDAVRARRCLIPTDGFYEWHRLGRDKQPYFVSRADGAPLVMAGIWQDWTAPAVDDQAPQTLTGCAIVTTGANGPLAAIHDRVPVILDPDDWPLWLGEAGHGAARLLGAGPPDRLRLWPVSRAVNSNRAAGADLVTPIAAPQAGGLSLPVPPRAGLPG